MARTGTPISRTPSLRPDPIWRWVLTSEVDEPQKFLLQNQFASGAGSSRNHRRFFWKFRENIMATQKSVSKLKCSAYWRAAWTHQIHQCCCRGVFLHSKTLEANCLTLAWAHQSWSILLNNAVWMRFEHTLCNMESMPSSKQGKPWPSWVKACLDPFEMATSSSLLDSSLSSCVSTWGQLSASETFISFWHSSMLQL